jgi:hypothetical protein
MPGKVSIEIRQTIDPGVSDYLFGTLWHWTALRVDERLLSGRYKSGFAYTEAGARRRAEGAARAILRGTVRYEYDPEGLL